MAKVLSSNPFGALPDNDASDNRAKSAPKNAQPKGTIPNVKAKKPKAPKAPKDTTATPAQAPAKEAAKAPAKDAKAPAKSAPAKPAAGNAKAPADQKENQQKAAPKGDNQAAAKDKKPLAPRTANTAAPAAVYEAPVGDDTPMLVEKDKSHRPPKDRRDSRPIRGPGGEVGGRAVPANNPNRRQFDRKSGTGRSKTENTKGGAGRHNWGNETDQDYVAEAEAVAHADLDKSKDAQAKKDEVVAEGAAEGKERKPRGRKEDAAPEEVKEPEKPVRSYDEYLKLQKGKKPVAEKLKARTVEVGDLKGMVQIKKDHANVNAVVPLAALAPKPAATPAAAATGAADATSSPAPAGEKKEKKEKKEKTQKEKNAEEKKKALAAQKAAIESSFRYNTGEGRGGSSGGRGGRGGRFERGDRSDRSDRGDRSDRSERGERSDRGDRGGRRDFNRTPGSGRNNANNANQQQAQAAAPAPVVNKPIFEDKDFPSIAPARSAAPAKETTTPAPAPVNA